MDLLFKGGPVMYLLLLCSISVISVFVIKITQLHKAQIDVPEFMSGLRNELINKRITEAVRICEEAPGPAANVLKTGIINYEEGRTGIESAMEKVSVYEIARMERGVSFIATIAVIAPLLGLLGTVFGLINIFQNMSTQGGLLTSQSLAEGLWPALLNTAFGLSIAIPVNIAYNYLVSKIHRITQGVQAGAAELVGILASEIR